MKVSPAIGLLVIYALGSLLWSGIQLSLEPGGVSNALLPFATLIGIAGLLLAVSFPSRFELTNQHFVARGGWLGTTRVALEDIEGAWRTHNPLATPYAYSLDRVQIQHRSGNMLIATTDNHALLEALAASCEHLTLHDGQVRRR
jgi:hypothetical protein